MVDKIPLSPTFTYENGVWNINIDALALPDSFKVKERKILYIPSLKHGGNHSHPREEIFITTHPCMRLTWMDETGLLHKEYMVGPSGEYYMFYVHAHTPHAVINTGPEPVVLLELADGPLVDVRPANLTHD